MQSADLVVSFVSSHSYAKHASPFWATPKSMQCFTDALTLTKVSQYHDVTANSGATSIFPPYPCSVFFFSLDLERGQASDRPPWFSFPETNRWPNRHGRAIGRTDGWLMHGKAGRLWKSVAKFGEHELVFRITHRNKELEGNGPIDQRRTKGPYLIGLWFFMTSISLVSL